MYETFFWSKVKSTLHIFYYIEQNFSDSRKMRYFMTKIIKYCLFKHQTYQKVAPLNDNYHFCMIPFSLEFTSWCSSLNREIKRSISPHFPLWLIGNFPSDNLHQEQLGGIPVSTGRTSMPKGFSQVTIYRQEILGNS